MYKRSFSVGYCEKDRGPSTFAISHETNSKTEHRVMMTVCQVGVSLNKHTSLVGIKIIGWGSCISGTGMYEKLLHLRLTFPVSLNLKTY